MCKRGQALSPPFLLLICWLTDGRHCAAYSTCHQSYEESNQYRDDRVSGRSIARYRSFQSRYRRQDWFRWFDLVWRYGFQSHFLHEAMLQTHLTSRFSFFADDAALPHGSSTDRTLGEEDLILIDVGGSFRGYVADITRVSLMCYLLVTG